MFSVFGVRMVLATTSEASSRGASSFQVRVSLSAPRFAPCFAPRSSLPLCFVAYRRAFSILAEKKPTQKTNVLLLSSSQTAEVSIARDYDKSLVPSLISPDAEGERVRDVIPNLLEVDVILVPVSQIRRKDGACTAIAWREEFEMKEAEKTKKTVDYINSIDLDKYQEKGAGVGRGGEEDEETKAMIAAEG